MRYYIDTEFDGYNGPLISMALIREDGRSLHFIIDGAPEAAKDPWVIENVLPKLKDCPEAPFLLHGLHAAHGIEALIAGDPRPVFVADWPDDIRHLCDLLHLVPGEMIRTPERVCFEIRRVDAYPTEIEGAVQHNAWWDALALQRRLEDSEAAEAKTFGAR